MNKKHHKGDTYLSIYTDFLTKHNEMPNKYLILFQLNTQYEKYPQSHQNEAQQIQSQAPKDLNNIEIFVTERLVKEMKA